MQEQRMRAIYEQVADGNKPCPADSMQREKKWLPIIWLPYLGFFLLQPAVDHASTERWVLTVLGTVVFLFFFFALFWTRKRWTKYCLVGIVLLGVLFAPINGGAATFFIYAAAFSPFLAESEMGGVLGILAVVATASLETWLLHLNPWFLVYAAGLAAFIGAGNIFFAQRNRQNDKLRMAKEEIEHLAKVAERERIARDLHDVLGHTLSVVILKSELAGKLVGRDPERAQAEIADVERIAREALAEVRNTIRGYRAQSLEAEFTNAKATLETAGLRVNAEAANVGLSPAQESVVALVVREAVTNVVRHAHARTCSLRLAPLNGSCFLEIEDDGRGGFEDEGNGLRGMRERIEALGGTLQRDTSMGTKLTIQFPLSLPKPADARAL
jgi:two-component system, NarL family, sensor histidine kinase DesK